MSWQALHLLPVALALLLAGAWWRASRRPLRLLCALLLALALLDPAVPQQQRGLDLLVLVDRSASAADAVVPRLPEVQNLLERAKGPHDTLHWIDFAEMAQVRGEGDEIPPSRRGQTRTALAVQLALARLPTNRAGRLLLLTDGYATEPLHGLAEKLSQQKVALDFRLMQPPEAADYRVERLELPARVERGEPLLLQVEAAGAPDGPVEVEIFRNETKLAATTLTLRKGVAAVRFTDRLTQTGAFRYRATVRGPKDGRPGNNMAERWVEVTGGRRVLLLSPYAEDPVAQVLAGQGYEVRRTPLGALNEGALSGTAAVIINNVAAHELPTAFLQALPFYVREQGGGLLLAGGKRSFGAGGYFGSAIDELLPVSMELRNEHRKLATALALVLDRSGSMSMTVAGGRQKMELADEGAARSIELLGGQDAVAVFAVDTEPHEVVGLTTLGTNREELIDVVRRIRSAGGGICVPTGLRAAEKALEQAAVGQRHVVLFADANDATQEPPDPAQIASMRKKGITVSVIGLGSETDSGGAYLREVAEQGGGRVFFNANAADLPALFAQETVAVARSAFLDKPVAVEGNTGWAQIAAELVPWMPAVDGYNLSYLRPEATGALLSKDEYRAPLVAFWQRGAGHTAAVSFPLAGDFSAQTRAWPGYGNFLQTLTRWLSREELPPGMALQTRLNGTVLELDLYHDETWQGPLAAHPPRVMLAEGANTRELTWERLEPGHLQARVNLPPEQVVRGAVQVGEQVLAFGPVVAGNSVEWRTDPERLAELQALSRASGGEERLDLTTIWQAPRRQESLSIRPWLLVALLGLVVLEALATRLGWQWRGRPL